MFSNLNSWVSKRRVSGSFNEPDWQFIEHLITPAYVKLIIRLLALCYAEMKINRYEKFKWNNTCFYYSKNDQTWKFCFLKNDIFKNFNDTTFLVILTSCSNYILLCNIKGLKQQKPKK